MNYSSARCILVIYSIIALIISFTSDIFFTITAGILFIIYFPGKLLWRIFKNFKPKLVLTIGTSVLLSSTSLSIFLAIHSNYNTMIWMVFLCIISLYYIFTEPNITAWDQILNQIWISYKKLNKFKKVAWASVVILMVITAGYTVNFLGTQKDATPFSEVYILSSNGGVQDYHNSVESGSNFSLILGLGNHEGVTIHYYVLSFLVDADYDRDGVNNVSKMTFYGSKDIILESDSPEINAQWGGQWEADWIFVFNHKGEFKLFFFVLKTILPQYLSNLVIGFDYSKTEVASLLNDTMHSEILNVNLNILVK